MTSVLNSLLMISLVGGCALDQKLAATSDIEAEGETDRETDPEADTESDTADMDEADSDGEEDAVDTGAADTEVDESATDTGSPATDSDEEDESEPNPDEDFDTDTDIDPVDTGETPSEPPSIRIYMPEGAGVYGTTGMAMFAAWIEDDLDPPEELSVSWETDRIGVFGIGETSDEGTDYHLGLSWEGRTWVAEKCDTFGEGVHTLKATVTDSDGLSASDTVTISFGTPL